MQKFQAVSTRGGTKGFETFIVFANATTNCNSDLNFGIARHFIFFTFSHSHREYTQRVRKVQKSQNFFFTCNHQKTIGYTLLFFDDYR